MRQEIELDNPFEEMKSLILSGEDHDIIDFAKRLKISGDEAKIIWICCPYFQEEFCRERITSNRDRGGAKYGSQNWLRRRFNLSEQEIDYIFLDIWENPSDRVSEKFLQVISNDRIAETQLTEYAQQKLKNLKIKYNFQNYNS